MLFGAILLVSWFYLLGFISPYTIGSVGTYWEDVFAYWKNLTIALIFFIGIAVILGGA